jgi:hypothetical protein
MVVDNVYLSIFGNIEGLEGIMGDNIEGNIVEFVSSVRLILLLSCLVSLVYVVVLSYFLILLNKRNGDIWDYFGCLEK